MKNSILFISLFILSIYCKSQNVLNQIDSLGRRQGEWIDFYDKAQKKVKTSVFYIDNNKDGKAYYYTKEGLLYKIHYYDQNRLILYKELFLKGDKKGQVKKVNGVKIKRLQSKVFYQIDSSQVKTNTNNNKNESGEKEGLWYEVVFINFFNIPAYHEYYVIGSYKDGLRNGVTYYYNYDNHSLQYEVYYVDGIIDGTLNIYNEFGDISVTYQYIKGKRNGHYIAFHNNGNLRYKGTMKDDKLTGQYFEYDKNGKLILYIEDAEKTPPY
jgi:uncharacterized protein